MKNELAYRVGGLLYTPALNETVADKIISGLFSNLMSISFCLEDSIEDSALQTAEKQLVQTLKKLYSANIDLPLIFVRIRTPKHMKHIHEILGDIEEIVTGYILPKFDLTNGVKYIDIIRDFNRYRNTPIYIMPILESRTVADIGNRVKVMEEIKLLLDSAEAYVLNVRVGGNDFSNLYGLRRNADQNIYQIGVIRDILVNIVNIFSADYVVSGPVWDYFDTNDGDSWETGLRNEIQLDLLNGFFGKTAIHPSQLPVIFDELKVSRADYEDAKVITGWQSDSFAVGKSTISGRMNEVKCHNKWAKQVMIRAEIYGVRGQ